MAISVMEYHLLSFLKVEYLLPSKPHILEFGESNWYGDVPIEELRNDISSCVECEVSKKYLLDELNAIVERNDKYLLFNIAKVFYKLIFDYSSISAIDLHGTEAAYKFNLNQPIEMNRQFDITINFGTAEHVFNTYQFFKTVHDLTFPGGLMLHSLPFTGWYDHGFYNFQPTFYWDLARANSYELIALIYANSSLFGTIPIEKREDIVRMVESGEISGNSMIFAVFQKSDRLSDFRVPMQGYYTGTLSEENKQAWTTLR